MYKRQVKAAADVYSPALGHIVAINESLQKQPECVNQDPYGQGWLYRLQPSDAGAYANLLSADAYLTMQK